jgi:cytosine/adenosine deaminase-related metal-dependent hydrolase
MKQILYRARWVLPVSSPPISGGVVTICGERIEEIGGKALGHTIDLGDVVLMPGLVNAHTHLEFSDCEKPLGKAGMPLPEWIRQVIGTRHRGDRDPLAAVHKGLVESLKAGVTTIGEIATTPASAYDEFSVSSLIAFQEVIGFSLARCESVQADLEMRLDLASKSKELGIGISPHAPYTVHPALLENLVQLAQVRQLPVAMHLAESREELELLSAGMGPFQQLLSDRSMWDGDAIPRGSRPLDYLKVLADAPRALVIHGNYLSDEEIGFLAEHRDRMSVVHCPRTHAYFAHERNPLEKMLTAGVRVALGTDSRASNPDLSLLGEMRYLAKAFPGLPAERIIKMATMASAEALGLGEETGSLTPGRLADMVAIPYRDAADPLETVLHSQAEPSQLIVRGKLMVLPLPQATALPLQ